MREIKFRGLRPDNVWEYGDLYTVPEKGWTLIRNRVDGERFFVRPETVGQFTGLKDYDGKDIYEGDILRDTEGRIFQAVWNAGAGAWEFVGKKYHMLFIMTYPDLYKVIGNVHDSPELLEGENA